MCVCVCVHVYMYMYNEHVYDMLYFIHLVFFSSDCYLHMQLHRVELERTQLQYSVESGSSRHSEELEAVQKSHE